MRPFEIGFALLAGAVLIFSACGTHELADFTSSGGGSAAAQCEDIAYGGEPFDSCLRKECCSEFAACAAAGSNCFACVYFSLDKDDEPKCAPAWDFIRAFRDCSFARCMVDY